MEQNHSHLYETSDLKLLFGDKWCGPDTLKHGERTLIAVYPKKSSVGEKAKVYCTALPAQFYTVITKFGHEKCIFGTGSGDEMAALAKSMAEAISKGMLTAWLHGTD